MNSQGQRNNLLEFPAVGTLWRWTKLASGPTGATLLPSIATLTSSVLIFRLLPQAQAGEFALLIAIAQTLSLLAGLGQGTLLRRLYGLQPFGHFDWRRDLCRTLLLTAPVASALSLIVNRIYNFNAGHTLFIFTATLGIITLANISQILSSQRHYVWGSMLARLPYSLLLVVMLPIAFVFEGARLRYVMISYLTLTLLATALGILLLRRFVRCGAAHVTLPERRQGIAFIITSLTYNLPEEGLFSIAGMLLDSSQLAVIAALSLFLRPFGVLYDALSQILLTELARHERPRYGRMFIALFGLSGAMAAGAIVLIPPVASLLYAGRYNAFFSLVPWLVAGAAMQLVEVLPRSQITARADNRRLNSYVGAHALIAVFGIGLAVGLITRTGLFGLAQGITLIYFTRNVASYYLSFRL